VNVFDHWRARDKSSMAEALGCGKITRLGFERKFPTGVGPRSPSIDVVLGLEGGTILAVESKFTEWSGHSGRKRLKNAYVPPDRPLWELAGLPGVQHTAESYMDRDGFDRLDVPQLLKHMLGLAT
jgi:hypothetical protein